ncbi:cysteine protease StiP family protein [Thioalkalicoccus limnaeus]|uniref:Cysteine protease StiP family protein n=1 Tax=Thioalkalicoccus limnaeus TaxID=120681 RepID=A0ABV4B8Z7_9GAMM
MTATYLARVGRDPITGSYAAEDCQFLLTPLPPRFVTVADKERAIQREGRHYSEMISREAAPDAEYLELFRRLTERYRDRLAGEILTLAAHIAASRAAPLTLVSLARAGTPVGALLQRALTHRLGRPARHYSISIIRDRGLDTNALRYLLRTAGRDPAGLVFVDAWTAKGVITGELKAALAAWNRREPEQLDDRLHVIADIGGCADVTATYDDYAIPSGILNATVSGLVSRTILNAEIAPDQFHGCVLYDELRPHDLTGWFLDQITGALPDGVPGTLPPSQRAARAARTAECLAHWRQRYRIADPNYIKPGVAEATRVLLRRVPARLILRDPEHPDVAHLRWLAGRKQVPVEIDPAIPFNAAAFIRIEH